MRSWIVAASGIGLVSGCGGAVWPPLDRAALPKAEDFPDVTWVVLEKAETVRFRPHPDTGEPVAEVSESRRVAKVRGDSEEEIVSVYYDRELEEVLELRARHVDRRGVETRFDGLRDGVTDVPAYGGAALYQSNRLRGFEVESLRVGSVLETRTRIRRKEPRLWRFGTAFEEIRPVEMARFSVVVPDGWAIDHRLVRRGRIETEAPRVEKLAGATRYVWERRDLPRIHLEDQAPPDWARGDEIAVQLVRWIRDGKVEEGFRSPEELSRWAFAESLPKLDRTPEMERHVRGLLEGVPDEPPAKAARLYQAVQDSVRYCISFRNEMDGFVPHEASRVFDLAYGDCKGKANLLRAFLDIAGIPSRLATIRWSDDGVPRPFALPTLSGNFNHMILMVDLPGGSVLADPTTRSVPFGRLPEGEEGAPYLVYDAVGSELRHVPSSAADGHAWDETYDLALEAGGGAAGTFEARGSGRYAWDLRDELLHAPAAKHAEEVGEWLDVLRPRVDSFAVTGIEPGRWRGEIAVRGEVELEPGGDAGAAVRTLRPAAFASSWLEALPDDERTTPLVFRHARSRSLRIRWRLPPGWEVASAPEPALLETPYARFESLWRAEEGALVFERRFELRETVVPLEAWADCRTFVHAVHAADERAAVLRCPGCAGSP